MQDLERIISYSFKDKDLLRMALTHSSYSREMHSYCPYNERLEFLGDAFLDAIIGEELFRMFPREEEGFLSKARASLVCEKSLAKKAREIGLGSKLLLGHGESKAGGRRRDSILADAMEATIGAVYLDGGYEAARTMVVNLFRQELKESKAGKFLVKDYKSALQELLQSQGIEVSKIRYVDTGSKGPDHNKLFKVRLEIEGVGEVECEGKSKKQAQQKCAEIALMRRHNVI